MRLGATETGVLGLTERGEKIMRPERAGQTEELGRQKKGSTYVHCLAHMCTGWGKKWGGEDEAYTNDDKICPLSEKKKEIYD